MRMTAIRFPDPDPAILARRDAVVVGLARLVAPDCLIAHETGRRALHCGRGRWPRSRRQEKLCQIKPFSAARPAAAPNKRLSSNTA